jgi:hypothetical protein
MISEKDQWLTIVRPVLGSIRSHADWVTYHAANIARQVEMLPYKPDFETEAEAKIDDAIEQLTNAVEVLMEAQRAYRSKPVK